MLKFYILIFMLITNVFSTEVQSSITLEPIIVTPCDDQNSDTEDDTIINGICIGKPIKCDDGNPLTEKDVIKNGVCLGNPIQTKGENTVTCKDMPTGSTFSLNGHIYKVVDNQTIKDRANNYKYVCTSNVTDMSRLFIYTMFNENISHWDTSNVEDMTFMFGFANDFNQPIGNWDVSKVKNMFGMFYRASLFNQDIKNWNVSNVEDMHHMFSYTNFNQDLSLWNVTKVKEMGSMFVYSKFNNSINKWCTKSLIHEPYLFSHEGDLWDRNKPNFKNKNCN